MPPKTIDITQLSVGNNADALNRVWRRIAVTEQVRVEDMEEIADIAASLNALVGHLRTVIHNP